MTVVKDFEVKRIFVYFFALVLSIGVIVSSVQAKEGDAMWKLLLDDSYEKAMVYRQTHYQLVDPQGDLSLMVGTTASSRRIIWSLTGQKKRLEADAQRKEQLRNEADSGERLAFKRYGFNDTLNPIEEPLPESLPDETYGIKENETLNIMGHLDPIKIEAFVKMLTEIMAEERRDKGIEPSLGEVHTWSEPFLRTHGAKYRKYTVFGKVLVALAKGVTSRFIISGQEEALKAYVVQQPIESVTMDKMFRASYELNNGDVYLTILTIENILSQYWCMPNRSNRTITHRLAPVWNFYQNRGDKFGGWYHFWGILLYGYVASKGQAVAVGATEGLGSHILNGFSDEKYEDFANHDGGIIGAALRKVVREKAYLNHVINPKNLDPKEYLNEREDYRDRIKIVSSPQFEATLDDDGLSIKNIGDTDIFGCHATVFFAAEDGHEALSKQEFDNVDLPKGKMKFFRVDDIRPGSARVFLTHCRSIAE